jgi:hypothetical protein
MESLLLVILALVVLLCLGYLFCKYVFGWSLKKYLGHFIDW